MRRVGLVYVGTALPIVGIVASQVSLGRDQQILTGVAACWLFSVPALVVARRALQRAPASDRVQWTMWFAGLAVIKLVEVGLVVGVVAHWSWANPLGPPALLLVGGFFTAGIISVISSRSGRRAVAVDLAEWLMAVVGLGASAVLLWGEAVVSSDEAWFTVPSAIAAVGMAGGVYWLLLLLARLGPERCAVETLGLALCLFGVADGALRVAHGLSGFELAFAPIVVARGTASGLMLLIPLYMTTRPTTGLDRLPVQAQVRSGGLATLPMLAGLPVLVVVTLAVRDERSWAGTFSFCVLILLLMLATLRHLTAVRETRRLYGQVERASEERRVLLANVIRRAEDDRHHVAAQLHEQAMSAYATFVSLVQAAGPATWRASPGLVGQATSLVRDDLLRQAESLRELMLATQPLVVDRPRSTTLDAPIRAYLDSLYGDRPGPVLDVEVDRMLRLDWITETIALRIVQEAINNVWRHSHASAVSVALRADGTVVEVRIEDDGVGFDPAGTLYESGIAAMRSFAAFANGSLTVRSTIGAGTVVVARLGDNPPPDTTQPDPGPHHPRRLRLV